jgi:hypothetical protein
MVDKKPSDLLAGQSAVVAVIIAALDQAGILTKERFAEILRKSADGFDGDARVYLMATANSLDTNPPPFLRLVKG